MLEDSIGSGLTGNLIACLSIFTSTMHCTIHQHACEVRCRQQGQPLLHRQSRFKKDSCNQTYPKPQSLITESIPPVQSQAHLVAHKDADANAHEEAHSNDASSVNDEGCTEHGGSNKQQHAGHPIARANCVADGTNDDTSANGPHHIGDTYVCRSIGQMGVQSSDWKQEQNYGLALQ
eukprot:scaffold148548_cov31-Tisochrysis_lutea.AAC.2